MKHFKVTITGKVQGVWYRGSTRHKALQLGLKGFVRNQPDGSVYLEAEGAEDDLKTLIRWCKHGPELAEVQNVEIEEGECRGFDGFEVIR